MPARRVSAIADRYEDKMVQLADKWCPAEGFEYAFGNETQVGITTAPGFTLSRNGAIQGWRVFPHGLAMAYKRHRRRVV
jgi:hypothetical protein